MTRVHTLLRWIIVVILLLVGVMVLGALASLAGSLLAVAFKVLIVLLLVAAVVRFFELLRQQR